SIDAGGQTTSGLIRRKAGNRQYEMLVEKDGIQYKPEHEGLDKILEKGGRLVLSEFAGKTGYELIDGERRWRSILLIPRPRRPLYKAKLIDAEDDVIRFLISGVA